MGSDERQSNVSLTVKNKVTRPQTKKIEEREESRSGIEQRSFGLPAIRLTARPNRLTSCLGVILWQTLYTAIGRTNHLEIPGEIKSREMELGSQSWMDCLATRLFNLFLNNYFSDTVFVSLLSTLLKRQSAKYTSCLALAGSPPP